MSVEYRKDVAGERLYASRNYNQLRHTFEAGGANRSGLDWNLTLRQQRKTKPLVGTQSAPELHTAALAENRLREPLAPEHVDGPYLLGETKGKTKMVGQLHNVAQTRHLLQEGGPRASGSGSSAHALDWHLALRDDLHQVEIKENKWRRHHTRSQPSFDVLRENCHKDNSEYKNSHITPQDRRLDRREGATPIATIRDDPISFKRWEGCEGTQVGQWRHLMEDHSKGRKTRRAIQAETTMRCDTKNISGLKFHPITDNRSDACIVEMMGKKKWSGATSHDPLHSRPPEGDAKLHYLSMMQIMPEDVPEAREKRISKHPRADKNIPERHEGRLRGQRAD